MAQEVPSTGPEEPDACCAAYDNVKQEEPLSQKTAANVSGPAKIANRGSSDQPPVLEADNPQAILLVMKQMRGQRYPRKIMLPSWLAK